MKKQWFASIKKLGIRLIACGLILFPLLMAVETASVQAKSPPRVLTGTAYFYVEEWGGVKIWQNYYIKEINPTTNAVKGIVYVTVYDPSVNGWKSLVMVPECAKFKDHTLTIVMEVVHKTGVGNGEVGEHAKWQVFDGGSPGNNKDTLTILDYQLDPWIEYWPVGVKAPTCDSFNPDPDWEAPLYVTNGDLTIH